MSVRKGRGREMAPDEPDRYPSDAEREGIIIGHGGKFYGMPERKVVALEPEEFRSGEC